MAERESRESTVDAGGDTPPGRVVVGVDGSESSKQALRWAVRLAASEGSTIEAVTAWDYPPSFNAPVDVNWRPDLDAETVMRETLDEVFGDDATGRARRARGPRFGSHRPHRRQQGCLAPRRRQPWARRFRRAPAGLGQLGVLGARALSGARPP